MARTNIRATRIKPEVSELLTTRVVRREQISPHMTRVTLGGGDLDRLRHLGFDQWFRLFMPTAGGALENLPTKLTMLSYTRFLAQSKATRPSLRTYSIRAHREADTGNEIDIDIVVHGSPDDAGAGPGVAWARTCTPGDPVALIDEGIGFNPAPGLDQVVLVAEESGLPGAAGILASLPSTARGHALLEVPTSEDTQSLVGPPGVEITWIVRDSHDAVPGRAALAAVEAQPLPAGPFYGWAVGEQALATGARRHWVRSGVPKENLMFCGYWRAGAAH
ncbi:siderophore-interacting protein [Pseudonocardia sulfidoxydans NBRC 16205]|uniref:Siderophore-interacting protein n=1 Tax=Pseudonocardia sulfidoxydans NBRC 16205 TaxID=1223511 RepID=A0A511DIM1_9PSEU|nr:siderophore-interacting protein [Pseudonocardia sulfidoxydans]GEL24297.1 siderophore-interacting protein [Pseudonocardia sulfidoxydans NBRC 16205]